MVNSNNNYDIGQNKNIKFQEILRKNNNDDKRKGRISALPP